MSKKSIRQLVLGLSAALLLLAGSVSGWSQSCDGYSSSTVTYVTNSGATSSGTPTTVIGVAANFTNFITYWLENFFFNSSVNSNYNSSYVIEVCGDSTGNLESAITATSLKPSMLFAADESPYSHEGTWTDSGKNYNYANGYPVLMGYTSTSATAGSGSAVTKTISTIGDLISGQSGSSLVLSATTLSNYTLSSTITSNTTNNGTLVADPDLAPYGAAAVNILNALQPLFSGSHIVFNSDNEATVPAWLEYLSTYGSIGKAFNAIGTATPTGFAAYAQICPSYFNSHTLPSTRYEDYVKFTGDSGTQEEFLTYQWMGYRAAYDSSADAGLYIYDLIAKEIKSGVWNSFITYGGADNCYGTVPDAKSGQ